MKKRMKRLTAVLLASALTFSLAACGGTSQETTSEESDDGKITLKITWWGSQSRHDYTQELLDAYTEEHPEIEFEAVPAGWDGYFDKLATEAASGSMPDIVQMDYLYISTYAKNDTVADLQPYIDDGTIDVSNIDENVLNSGVIDGKMAGMVISTSMIAFAYNPDALSKAGISKISDDWTWDDFIEISEELKDAGIEDAASIDPTSDTNLFNYWVRQHGEELFNEEGTALGYEDDQLLADYLSMCKEMMDEDLMPTPDEYEQISTLGLEASPVVTGEAAITQNWNNYSTLVSASNDNIQLVAPPTIGDDDEQGLWLKPGMFFSVSETSEHKEEAAEFINWFVNSEEANEIIMAERGTPVSSEIRQYLIDSGEMTQQQTDMFEYIDSTAEITGETPAPDPTGMSEINKLFKDIGNTVFYGQQSAEEAAASFRTQANDILERNNG